MCKRIHSLSWCGFLLFQSVRWAVLRRGRHIRTAQAARQTCPLLKRGQILSRCTLGCGRTCGTVHMPPTQEEWSDGERGEELARNPSFVTVRLRKKQTPTQRHFYFPAIRFCFGTSRTQGFIIRDWALWCNFRGIKHLLIKSISTSLAQQCPTCRHCLEMWVANAPSAPLHFLLTAACRGDPAALTF